VEMTVLGLALLLVGLCQIGLGIHTARPSRAELYDPETRRLRRRSRAEQWLELMGLTLMGLGYACFGLIVLRYPADPAVSVSARAPLIDHVAWAVVLVGLIGGHVVCRVGIEILRTAEKKRARGALADDL